MYWRKGGRLGRDCEEKCGSSRDCLVVMVSSGNRASVRNAAFFIYCQQQAHMEKPAGLDVHAKSVNGVSRVSSWGYKQT